MLHRFAGNQHHFVFHDVGQMQRFQNQVQRTFQRDGLIQVNRNWMATQYGFFPQTPLVQTDVDVGQLAQLSHHFVQRFVVEVQRNRRLQPLLNFQFSGTHALGRT